MFKKIKKISRDVKGFTLTEVMIGMMILTVAIVSASNLLTGIISSNQNNLTTLQAYYLSQEGLEMVRNIRDTNWLHNRDWLGAGAEGVWGEKFEIPGDISDGSSGVKEYVVKMADASGVNMTVVKDGNSDPAMLGARSWEIAKSTDDDVIYRHGGDTNPNYMPYLDSSNSNGDPTSFHRKILIKKYDCSALESFGIKCPGSNSDSGGNPAYILVQSKVTWKIGAKDRELVLSEVLSNWKGGAL